MIDLGCFIPELCDGIYKDQIQLPTEIKRIEIYSYQESYQDDYSVLRLDITDSNDNSYIYRTLKHYSKLNAPERIRNAAFTNSEISIEVVKDTNYIVSFPK